MSSSAPHSNCAMLAPTVVTALDDYVIGAAACSPSLPPPPPGSSSLRVRFRMTTRQSSQHQFRAKISSNSPSISQSPSSPALSLITANTNCDPAVLHSSTSKLNHHQHNNQQHQHQHAIAENINNNVWFYDDFSHGKCRASSTHNLTTIPINIGLNCTSRRLLTDTKTNFNETDSKSSFSSLNSSNANANTNMNSSTTTTKTFRLTEDLRSNIRLDITLKPTMSIRDNRLDATSRLNRLKQMHNVSTLSNSGNAMHRSVSCESANTLGSTTSLNNHNIVQKTPTTSNHTNDELKSSFTCMEVIKKNLKTPSGNGECLSATCVDEDECGVSGICDDSSCYSSRSLRRNNASIVEKDLVATNIPYRTSIPVNSSITFKIRNFTNLSNETTTTAMAASSGDDLIREALMATPPTLVKTSTSCKRSSSSVCMIKSSTLCRSNSNTMSNNNLSDNKHNYKRANSPFTFIETYSVCKHHQEEQQQLLQRIAPSQTATTSSSSTRLTLSPNINTNVYLNKIS